MTKNALPATLSPVYDQGDGTYEASPPPSGGGSFTITGSGFGTKASSAPAFDDFESSSVGLVGSTIGQLKVSTTGATSVTSAISHSGTKCLTHDFISVDFPKLYREFATRSRYARMSCWWRWTGSVTSSSVWKLLRFNTDSTDPYSGINRFSAEYTAGASGDRPSAFSGITYIDGAIVEYSGTNEVADRMDLFTPDTWHFMEWEIDAGTLNGNNATIRQKIDGVENIRFTNTPFLTTANPDLIKFILSPINGLDGATNRNVQYFVDELYSDNSLCRVIMTDNATYSLSTKWAEQPVAADGWSDTSIECTYNRGSFTIGATAYRHVFNSSGTLVHSTAGFTVT
jgi:hypothetical protein